MLGAARMCMNAYSTIFAACAALLLSSCGEVRGYAFSRETGEYTPQKFVNQGYWDATAAASCTGPRCIVVDTHRQQVDYFIGETQVGFSTCSTGTMGRSTPRGTYKVLEKDADHVSSTYGSIVDRDGNVLVASYSQKNGGSIPPGGIYRGAPMNHAMQLTTWGIWMHEGDVTGAPESHGCIRLPAEMAKVFFENTPIGTTVIVR